MFDMQARLNEFYEKHVRLGQERAVLAAHRDTSLQRLALGLEALDYPSGFYHRNQGSYAMHTINQQPTEYDIDVAVIFAREDLPGNALDARKRIEEAMREGGGNFEKPPEALTNAVRVYYAEGHHIDLAIYRSYEDSNGDQIYEHAGSDWSSRNPEDITSWFNQAVRDESPSDGPGTTVGRNQMRRVVRWLKAFSKSREQWNLPGGLIISALVVECYMPDSSRDDLALYNTMASIRNRLTLSREVKNPVDETQSLTSRKIDVARLERFETRLEEGLAVLGVLWSPACSEEDAAHAWHWVFLHDYWISDDEVERQRAYGKRLGEAARQGAVYITSAGGVHLERPRERHQQAPKQRFYGDI